MTKYSLGICIGASTVSFVKSKEADGFISVVETESITHDGNPKKIVSEYFEHMDASETSIVATGRKFKELINTHSISEPEAVEKAIKFLGLNGEEKAIASLGSESFIVYHLNSTGSIDNVITGNKCASGTGEFFLQQISRMNLDIEQARDIKEENKPYSVSGRCSVFCKSDCTHALNKGIPREQVVSGLSRMIAEKTIELLSKQNTKKVLIIGGVSKNNNVVNYIKKKYPDLTIPEEAPYFEALGASLCGLEREYNIEQSDLFKSHKHSFSLLKPLRNDKNNVIFKEMAKDSPKFGDECILGLDVGSTTTKAVIIRESDKAMLASVYLRTNGNPVQAAVNCYKELKQQILTDIKIIGLGTTGSGRNIAALHALSKSVVNEIIAHAVAAAHFDKDVDTIFEIGGQDAKYTHLTNGVASDYAMNEACSAGTGSFLEEAAKETLNINYLDIGEIAFKSDAPLNFNDQCAAFISSDIKNASHEGASREDIVAGLVYSICMNYVNRVKGNRPVGKKVFMQGGVCYNKAVPFAMANLVNKEIIVPPEPGLMGAFGVALEVKNRIELGFTEKTIFNLDELINRDFKYGTEFVCAGGAEKCDRKCGIAIIEVEGKKYPFGGACNKYYNERINVVGESGKHNYVNIRQDLVFNKYIIKNTTNTSDKKIGISRSLLTNTLYPLYHNFFAKLGYKIVLSDEADTDGKDKIQSSFCYPVELSHGFFSNLLKKDIDYIFLPHVTQMDSHSEHQHNRLCVFVQGETYFLKSTFRDELEGKAKNENGKKIELISPVIDFTLPDEELKEVFIRIAKGLGNNKKESADAFDFANSKFKAMQSEFIELGKKALEEIERDPDNFGIVLFGRSYNAFAREANLNIPHKFASKNITIIPHDFLPNEIKDSYENMYWYSGHQILSNARFVKSHKQLFGVYITNFSCGPDSFILSYFRRIMGSKPSLTLELDSHSADVGIDTRIDAAIDIIKNYLVLFKKGLVEDIEQNLNPLQIITEDKKINIIDSNNKKIDITSKDVEVLIPSMGRYSSDAFAAVFRSLGINCRPLEVPTLETLKHGRGQTTCKECLPFILTTGSLTEYLENHYNRNKNTLFFMPRGYGPCRQGQYHILLKDIINNLKIENVGVLTMDDESSFDDFGSEFFIKQWIGLVIADVVHDIESAVSAIGINKKESLDLLNSEWKKITESLETGDNNEIFNSVEKSAKVLSKIKLEVHVEDAKVISLIGEIYVRREEFSRGDLVKTLTDKGFVVKTAPITEYVYYSNYLLKKEILNGLSMKEKTLLHVKDRYQRLLEKRIKKIFAKTGLIKFELIDIDKTMEIGERFIAPDLIGEGILTTGLAMREILDDTCGVISIGPFNCIPSRLSEAILKKEMTMEGKYRSLNITKNGYPEELKILPFLYVETDGNSFPQIIQSKIEIFMMQAEKVHMILSKKKAAIN
jgi:predicted CoA-substrate-specific enzyme activase